MRYSFRMKLLSGACAGAMFFGAHMSARADSLDVARKYWENSGLWVSLEGGYSLLKSERINWAENNSTIFGPLGTHDVDSPNRGGNWGIAVGFPVSRRFDVALRYSGVKSSHKSAYRSVYYATPGIPFLGAALGPVRTYYYQGSVKTSQEMHIVDFEVGYNVGLGSRTKLRAFGGLRYINFRQKTDTSFTFQPFGYYYQTEQIRSTYWGIGPRLGLDGKVLLLSVRGRHLSVIAGIAGSVTFGQSSISITQQSTFLGNSRDVDSGAATVFNVEGYAGLSYSFPLGNWAATLTGGYKIGKWYSIQNVRGTAGRLVGFATARQYGNPRGDLLQHGPFLRLTVTF